VVPAVSGSGFANAVANTDPQTLPFGTFRACAREDVCHLGGVIVKNVGIDPQRDSSVSVAEPIGNHMHRYARKQQDRCVVEVTLR